MYRDCTIHTRSEKMNDYHTLPLRSDSEPATSSFGATAGAEKGQGVVVVRLGVAYKCHSHRDAPVNRHCDSQHHGVCAAAGVHVNMYSMYVSAWAPPENCSWRPGERYSCFL